MSRPSVYLGFIALLVLPLGGMGKADLPQTEQAEIQRLIRQLGSEDFQEREAASRGLAAVGEQARQALRTAMHDQDPEVRRRAAALVGILAARNRAREAAALQGVWVLKTTEYLGEEADQDPVDDELEKLFLWRRDPVEERELNEDASQRRTTLEFRGNTFERRQWIARSGCWGRAGIDSIKGTYDIEVDRRPKVMERRWEAQGIGDEAHVRYCIYSLRGDTLLMCIKFDNGPDRLPTRFVTADDEDVVLLTFKRERK